MEPPKNSEPTSHRPDASAQSRILTWLVLGGSAAIFLPCLLLALTEATGTTHLLERLIPADGTLTVKVDDPNATVLITGQYFSRVLSTSQDNRLEPGDYTITVTSTANGQNRRHSETVTIESGKVTVVTVPWTREPDTPASLELDGVPFLADIPHQSFTGWGASWSLDGRRIALQTSQEIGPDPPGMLEVLTVESGQHRPLLRGGKDPAWSPREDGPIAYVLHRDQHESIWLIDANGQNNRRLVEGGYPSWSADGSTLYYHHYSSGTLRAIDVDDPDAKPRTLMKCRYRYPSVSPDGTKVVLRDESDLVIYGISSGEVVLKHSLGDAQGLLASWSPDSRQILFGGYGFQTDLPLTLIDVDTGTATHLLQESLTLPRFSPDGTRLVADDRIQKRVVVLNAADVMTAPQPIEDAGISPSALPPAPPQAVRE